MTWTITTDLGEYATAAGAFLRSNPADNTLPLSVLASLTGPGAEPPPNGALFGWWTQDGETRAAFHYLPPRPAVLTSMPPEATAELAKTLADRDFAASLLIAPNQVADAFTQAWHTATGTTLTVHNNQRLYRLDGLRPPATLPAGTFRIATAADHDLVLGWFMAFETEVNGQPSGSNAFIEERLAAGCVGLWDVDGTITSMASRTPVIFGMDRVSAVYTPAEHRGHGYGAAVTSEISRTAGEAGATEIVLFTDLANPTSNAIYQRLGYRPVRDQIALAFPESPEKTTDRDRG